MKNPFLIYGYEGPAYFCDREQETKEIISSLQNGCNLTLMSPRRYGKTGLIRNAFHYLQENDTTVACFYIDIYATNTMYDFVQAFGKSVIGKLDTPLQRAEGLLTRIFRSSQITMSTDLATGMPQFGLGFQPQYSESTLEDIFTYIEQSGKQCYIAIDEFQQVLDYPEKNIEALLRTYVQKTHNAHFIFSGSKLHMMSEMFNSPKHPFYRSTEKIHLNVLNEDVYYRFCANKLQAKNLTITPEVFHSVYSMVDGVTWYIQAIMNRLYRLEKCDITQEICQRSIQQIIQSEEEDYKRLYHLLTINQARLLKAIAIEGIVREPNSSLFIRTHNLKTSSSVQRAIQFLSDEEYIYKTDQGYIVYDRFFGMWLKQLG